MVNVIMKVRGRGKKLIHGIGVNDSLEPTEKLINGIRVRDEFYVRWQNVIIRCYSKRFLETHANYVGCTMSDEWLIFSNFKAWMKKQDWKGKDLDKDILIPGNKLYSKETCVFVSRKLNSLLVYAGKSKWPNGVSFHNKMGKFRSKDGTGKHLGYYDTPEQAASVYNLAKSNYIREIIATEEEVILNDILKQALIRHADRFFELHLKYKGF